MNPQIIQSIQLGIYNSLQIVENNITPKTSPKNKKEQTLPQLYPITPPPKSISLMIYTKQSYFELESQYKLESRKMGNQTQISSRFSEQHHWLLIAKDKQKELIQNKLSREIVEIHRLPRIETHHIRSDSLVYQWRQDPKTAIYAVQILQMSHPYEQQERNCLSACHMPETHVDLLIYTQNILKLYQTNPKIQLDEGDQLGIFKDIVQGLDILSEKFGEFIPNKNSVGYNTQKRGKVWINDNFALNITQQKRKIRSKQDRALWQSQAIQTIVGICRLCITQNNYRNHKFYYLLETIKNNRLNSFNAVRSFQGPERKVILIKQKEVENIPPEIIKKASKEVQLNNSQNIRSSNEFMTTLDPRQKRTPREEFKLINKSFEIAYINVHQPSQAKPVALRTAYNHPNQNQLKFTHRQEKQKAFNKLNQKNNNKAIQHANSYLKPHPNELRKHKTTNYVGQNFYPQRDAKSLLHAQRQQKQRPEHYALLQQLYESRSSRSESKMIKKDTIQLIDSMQVVQNRHEYDNSNGFHKLKNMIMEQSIIVKAAKR